MGEKVIGKLQFSRSNRLDRSGNAIIFKGLFENSIEVAIKRVQKENVRLEIDVLRMCCERDPNIINYRATEEDDDFYYIGMELCLGSLKQYIDKQYEGPDINIRIPEMLKQAVSGLKFLHQRNIVHRDIRPQKILISQSSKGAPIQIKLSGFAISKIAKDGKSDYSMSGPAPKSEGWKACELLIGDQMERHTNSVDIFAMGCVIYYALTNGEHPFGYRDENVSERRYNLPEELPNYKYAIELIESMINDNPEKRPSAEEVLAQPFFILGLWSAKETLDFIRGLSESLSSSTTCQRSSKQQLVIDELEKSKQHIFSGNWKEQFSPEMQRHIDSYRPYSGNTVFSLLKAIRNKYVHYEGCAEEEKSEYGPVPDAYWNYWSTRFPNFIFYAWKAGKLLHE